MYTFCSIIFYINVTCHYLSRNRLDKSYYIDYCQMLWVFLYVRCSRYTGCIESSTNTIRKPFKARKYFMYQTFINKSCHFARRMCVCVCLIRFLQFTEISCPNYINRSNFVKSNAVCSSSSEWLKDQAID